MTKTYKLTKIIHAVDIAISLSRSWFRGHSEVQGNLTPGIFRDEYQYIKPFREDVEFEIIHSFKRYAPTLATNLPNQENHLTWLFLMQHHGTPTRLLDWSESALIALYFAVYENPSKDGELWAMYPDQLNLCSGIPGIPLPNHPSINYLAAEPLSNNLKKLAEEFNLEKFPKYPIAIRL
jgi:hypothetical protein